jgi:DNA-binding MarR family transcriptional regulator
MADSFDIDELATSLRMLVGRLKRKLREQANVGDFTPSQIAVLLRLQRDGPTTSSALARAEGMRAQSMGAIIGPLQEARLVAGSPDPADGRQILIDLTDHCRTIMREGTAARQDWLTRRLQGGFSSGEQREIAHAVKLLARLLD